MDSGYIKLWRCSVESQVFNNEGLWKLWCWCLTKATYKKRWVNVITGRGGTEVELLPGQFIFGRNTAADTLKMKPSTLNKRMKKLKTIGNLNIESNTHYSIVTICNWGKYQPEEINKEQAKEQPRNNQGTTKEHKQEGKESKEGKEKDSFDHFWEMYPRKINKQQAMKSWKKIKDSEHHIIFKAIEMNMQEWSNKEKQFIPHASTWLNNRRWDDEVEMSAKYNNDIPGLTGEII